jgi:DNA-binding transcriptional MerR regulator
MEGNVQHESLFPDKDLYRIGEVSRLTATKQFVLRYWEKEFPTLQPVKSPKGHRLYRRQDIETVFVIKRLLYDEGFTIAGARRHLRDQAAQPNGSNGGAATSEPQSSQPSLALNRKMLLDLRDSLRSFLTLLEHE